MVRRILAVFVLFVASVAAHEQTGRPADAAGATTSRFVPVAPTRLFDTRPAARPLDDGIDGLVAPGGSVRVNVAARLGRSAAELTAVVLNVTITEATGPGYVQVVPGGATVGGSSNLNVESAGQTIANQVTVPVAADGSVTVFTQGGGHLLADVFGWFTPAVDATAGRYEPLPAPSPRRILDTRPAALVAPGGTVRVPIAAPGQVSAVVLGVTVTEATAPGFWQVVPTGGATALGSSSNLNVTRSGQTIANQVIVPVGADGSVTVFSQAGGHVVVDEAGVITGAGAARSAAGLFVPITPDRLVDTRDPRNTPIVGPLRAGGDVTVSVAGRSGIASSAIAVALNVTVTEASGPGYVQVLPTGLAEPGATSNINVERAGQTIADAAWATVGSSSSFSLFTQRGGQLLADAAGWFTSGAVDVPLVTTPTVTPTSAPGTSTTVPGTPAATTFAYVGTYDTSPGAGVTTFAVDAGTGALSRVGRTAATSPAFFAVHPSQHMVYAVNEIDGAGTVEAFSVDPGTGLLTPAGTLAVGSLPAHLLIDPTGGWLVVANYNGESWTVVSLLPDGRLGAVTDTVVRHGSGPTNRQFTSHPHGSAFDPTGRYLATVDLGTDTLEVFQLVAGVMQSRQVVRIAAGAGPRHVLFRPDGSAVYVLNELNSSISVFAFDEGTGSVGSLQQTIDTVPAGFPANRSSAELLIDPTGQFLYASNRRFVDHPQADSIAEFRIGPTGRLTSLGWFTAGIATPRTMSFDPQGRWLYVLNQDGASIEQLVADPTTGLLSATGRVTSLTEPVGIAFATP